MKSRDERLRFELIVKVLIIESTLIVGVLLLISGIVVFSDVQGIVYALVGYTVGTQIPAPIAQLIRTNNDAVTRVDPPQK